MTISTQELNQIFESLPEEKQLEVVNFARLLLAQQDEAKWENSLSSTQRLPKLEAFLKTPLKEPTNPLDPNKR